MEPIVTINPKVMDGTPCFAGTFVAVKALFEHLKAGYNIDEFLHSHPTVRPDQAVRLLEESKRHAEQLAISING